MKKSDAAGEVASFLESLSFSVPFDSKGEFRSQFNQAFRKFHCLLVWGFVKQDKKPISLKSQETYLNESLSDYSHAMLLTLLGYYKPARVNARSGIENALRYMILEADPAAQVDVPVPELFKIVKSKHGSICTNFIESLQREYAELCKAVHSSNVDYMSLVVPFERLHTFNGKKYSSNMILLFKVYSATNNINFVLWHNKLHKAGRHNEDKVLDNLPKYLKRQLKLGSDGTALQKDGTT